MNIENFKLVEFYNQPSELIERYIVALQYIKPAETKRQVFNMKLKHVELVKETLASGNDRDLIKVVAKVQKITKEEVLEMPIIEFFSIVNSIREQLKTIIKAEENALTPSKIDFNFEAVEGSERMAKFGIYNTLEALSGGDALKCQKYMNMEFAEIFTVLYMRKTSSDIREEMQEIEKIKD